MGWWSGSTRDYDNASVESVDPRKVQWHNKHGISRRQVEKFKRNPNAPAEDGDAYIVRKRNGTLVGVNGRHRGIAAVETGRNRITARVHDERKKGRW